MITFEFSKVEWPDCKGILRYTVVDFAYGSGFYHNRMAGSS